MPTQSSVSPIRSWGWESDHAKLLAFINYDKAETRDVRLDAEGTDRARILFGPALQKQDGSAHLTLQPGEFAALVW